ncbi:hypothetical protein LCGC14_2202110, partial [marine sediment metagenome]
MQWHRTGKTDPACLALADRHYNRRSVGSSFFLPPGRDIVLRTATGDALWATLAQRPEYQKHAWPGAWVNPIFRNESGTLSSALIREAIAATLGAWGALPAAGL